MRSTVKAWFIANTRIWYGLLLVIFAVGTILYLGKHSETDNDQFSVAVEKIVGEGSLLTSSQGAASGEDDSSATWLAFALALSIFFPICYNESNESTALGTTLYVLSIIALAKINIGTTYIIATAICAFVLFLYITIWTYNNINEVVSRRMRFRSSSKDLFNFTLQYSLNRGVHVLLATFSIFILAFFVVMLTR